MAVIAAFIVGIVLAVVLSPRGGPEETPTPAPTSPPTVPLPFEWSLEKTNVTATDCVLPGYLGSQVAFALSGTVLAALAPQDDYVYGEYSMGSMFIFKANSTGWTQQGPKIVPANVTFKPHLQTMALSQDGHTAAIGADQIDDFYGGGIWVFVLTDSSWLQQGPILHQNISALSPSAMAISGNGNMLISGADGSNGANGSVIIWTRTSEGVWSLTQIISNPTGISGENPSFGSSLALSDDGKTLVVGAHQDTNEEDVVIGAAWIFVLIDGIWTQQGPKLVGNDTIGTDIGQGNVRISGDGNTMVSAGDNDNYGAGAFWVFTRNPITNGWSQYGNKLTCPGGGECGQSLAISGDGENIVVISSPDDDYDTAPWFYRLINGVWSLQSGSGVVLISEQEKGIGVAISYNGSRVAVGLPQPPEEYESGQGFVPVACGSIVIFNGGLAPPTSAPTPPTLSPTLAPTPPTASPTIPVEPVLIQAIHPPPADDYSSFCSDVDTQSNNFTIIAQPALNSGVVFVYAKNASNLWSLVQTIANPVLEGDSSFGVNISIGIDKFAVNSLRYVHVYALNASNLWTHFWQVSHYIQTIAFSYDTSTLGIGDYLNRQLILYTLNAGKTAYVLNSTLTLPTAVTINFMLLDISSNGKTVACSAVMRGPNNGAVLMYTAEQDNGSWVNNQILIPTDSTTTGYFGSSISLSKDGSELIVGTPLTNGDTYYEGAAWFFERPTPTSSWTQSAKVVAAAPHKNNRFGWSVAISEDGQRFAAGAYHARTQAGLTYEFYLVGGNTWTQVGIPFNATRANSGDEEGYTVAISGDTIMSCSPFVPAAFVFTGT